MRIFVYDCRHTDFIIVDERCAHIDTLLPCPIASVCMSIRVCFYALSCTMHLSCNTCVGIRRYRLFDGCGQSMYKFYTAFMQLKYDICACLRLYRFLSILQAVFAHRVFFGTLNDRDVFTVESQVLWQTAELALRAACRALADLMLVCCFADFKF